MSLAKDVAEALKLAEASLPISEELRRLVQFNEEMKRLGVVRRQEYTLPLIDTVGRSQHLWYSDPSSE